MRIKIHRITVGGGGVGRGCCRHTHTHTQTHTHRHPHISILHTYIPIPTHRLVLAQGLLLPPSAPLCFTFPTYTHTHTHTDIHTYIFCIPTYPPPPTGSSWPRPPPSSLLPPCLHALRLPLTHTHTHTQLPRPSNPPSYKDIHTQTQARTHTQTHTSAPSGPLQKKASSGMRCLSAKTASRKPTSLLRLWMR